jgi:plasmid rolling circle replication initiator protein Rep
MQVHYTAGQAERSIGNIKGVEESNLPTKTKRVWNGQGYEEREVKRPQFDMPGWKLTDDELVDRKKNGKDRNWARRKQEAVKLAEAYHRLGLEKRSRNTGLCANFLEFLRCSNVLCKDYGKLSLVSAKLCHDPLCPICNWRRADVHRAQVFKVFEVAHSREMFDQMFQGKEKFVDMQYIHLTLTIQNVFGGKNLNKAIKALHYGFKKMREVKPFKGTCLGWFRSTEVTRNNNWWDEKWNGSYHPHMHVILAVENSYFHSMAYLNKDMWIKMWREKMGLDYDPDVKVQAITAKRVGQTYHAAVVETAKYIAKSSDYLKKDEKVTDKVVSDFLEGLKDVKRIGWGGIFYKIRSKLNMVDVESKDADLVGADTGNGVACESCGEVKEKVYGVWDYDVEIYFMAVENVVGAEDEWIQVRLE